MPRERICRGCNQSFRPKKSHNVFCSKECFDNWQRGRPTTRDTGPKIAKTCAFCQKQFRVSPTLNYRVYCSQKCFALAKVGVPRNTGEQNPQWKGGVSSKHADQRKSWHYKQWRAGIFARDGFTCQKCHKRGGRLAAHHLYEFANYPELRLHLANGHTLCKTCHDELKGHEREYRISLGLPPDNPPFRLELFPAWEA